MVKTEINKEGEDRGKYFSDVRDVLIDFQVLIKNCPPKYLMISCSSSSPFFPLIPHIVVAGLSVCQPATGLVSRLTPQSWETRNGAFQNYQSQLAISDLNIEIL